MPLKQFGAIIPWFLSRASWFFLRPLQLGGCLFVLTFVILDASGILEGVYLFTWGVWYSFRMALHYSVSGRRWVSGAYRALEGFTDDYNLKTWQVVIGLVTSFIAVLCSVRLFFGPATKASPGSSAASTPTASGCVTPQPPPPQPTGPSSPTTANPDSNIVVVSAIGELMRSQNSFNERLFSELSKLSQSREPPLPPPGPVANVLTAEDHREELKKMMARLDQFESLIRSDRASGSGQQSGESARPLPRPPSFGTLPVSGEVPGKDMATVAFALPQGSPGEGEASTNPADVAGEEEASGVKSVIDNLLLRATNPHDLIVAELRRYKDIPLANWPLPVGFRSRICPAYLAHVYGRGRVGEEHATIYLSEHGLEDCHPAKALVTVLSHFDRLLLVDKKVGFINDVSSEFLARQGWGFESCFSRCRSKNCWLKPRSNAPKDWKSKVDWELYHRIVPPDQKGVLVLREAEDELRGEIDRDAMLLKSRAKLAAHQTSSALDPLNT